MKLSFKNKCDLTTFKKYIEKKEDIPNVKAILNIILDESSSEEAVTNAVLRLQSLMDAKGKETLEATLLLGYCKKNAIGIAQDYKNAVELFTLGAEQRYAPALSHLGDCHSFGHGVDRDIRRAIGLYYLATKQGFSECHRKLGLFYQYGLCIAKNSKRAVEHYILSANQGDPTTQFALGMCYYYECGVEQDIERAALLFQAAAEQGYEDANGYVATMTEKGESFPHLNKALAYYNNRKDDGPSFISNLAFCYQMGLGVKQNIKEALTLYLSLKTSDPLVWGSRNWDIYMCHLIQIQQGIEVKTLGEFYKAIHLENKKGNKQATLFLAYLHEYGAPGFSDQSLFAAHNFYKEYSKTISPKRTESVKKMILEENESEEVVFELFSDDPFITIYKLADFETLPKLYNAILEVIQNTSISEPGITKLITEYAFEGRVLDKITNGAK